MAQCVPQTASIAIRPVRQVTIHGLSHRMGRIDDGCSAALRRERSITQVLPLGRFQFGPDEAARWFTLRSTDYICHTDAVLTTLKEPVLVDRTIA